ncbi:MAG: AtpZ/AtpI family protein [Hyphomicrobiaceae bacterium]|nr:AtpZ/AtpI family protein [Hyphomicrobiaceae bacterium]
MSNNGKGHGSGRGEISREDREALRARAAGLGDRLEQVKARRAPQLDNSARGAALGQAFKIAIELVVGVVFGGLVGWALDRYLGSAPWLLVLFLVLGFAAGIMNVVRTARRMQAAAEPLQRAAAPVEPDEDDR